LPPNERIVVQWNNECQPISDGGTLLNRLISDGGTLLNRLLGSIARNYNAFPISYSSWRKITKDYKEDMLKTLFRLAVYNFNL